MSHNEKFVFSRWQQVTKPLKRRGQKSTAKLETSKQGIYKPILIYFIMNNRNSWWRNIGIRNKSWCVN